ncbi:hypothetical protein EVAR_58246_1 [Eumeta japonica]|uniref:Uncharacterized protein n=1 Tax=Eumeta variegata TaxID=151549 RepID=A0A4C2AE59_EUMVA|nr:hypothetical protein EVAR_58246_1 [Eumeta japonica]
MFLRVRVCAPDQRAQLFLWRDEYPNAEMAVKRDHYVDDFICSTDSVPEAAKLISDVTIVHARGLRYPGWATNAPELKPVGGVVRGGRHRVTAQDENRTGAGRYGNRNATV